MSAWPDRASAGVQTVQRGLQVLRAFRSDRAALSNLELVQRTGLSKATVSRLTSTLLHLGYLRHVPGSRAFALSAAPLGIGHAYLAASEDRFMVPVSEHGDGALFLQVNRNKRSIALDIECGEGRAVLHELVRRADVVVANMPPRSLRNLGLDYDTLPGIRPDIILTASSAFGLRPSAPPRPCATGPASTASARPSAAPCT
jgi:hypothetical protein